MTDKFEKIIIITIMLSLINLTRRPGKKARLIFNRSFQSPRDDTYSLTSRRRARIEEGKAAAQQQSPERERESRCCKLVRIFTRGRH